MGSGFFNPGGTGGTCSFNQAEDLRGLRRIKGPMKWCNLRSDFTNEFTVASSRQLAKSLCATREQVGVQHLIPRFDPEQERFFGLRSTLLFMSNIFRTTTAIKIHNSETLSILNEALCHPYHISLANFSIIYLRIYDSRDAE